MELNRNGYPKNYFYSQTNYPKIYIETYWGSFDSNSKGINFDRLEPEIIDNRNKFIVEYNIKCILKYSQFSSSIKNCLLNHKKSYYFDHIELYRTNDSKYIMLNSPTFSSDDLLSFLDEYEFVKIYSLYSSGHPSFIRIFNNRKDLSYFAKSLINND